MPKFKRPKKAVGLNLRAVIEGELVKLPFNLNYAQVSEAADAIETRIQDGPSDWLSLSNGTTFDKSWVPDTFDEPEESQVVRGFPLTQKVESFGRNLHENLVQHAFAEDKLGALGHDSNRLLVKSLHNISNEHEKRVAAHKLEHEIQAHEDWLESERNRK